MRKKNRKQEKFYEKIERKEENYLIKRLIIGATYIENIVKQIKEKLKQKKLLKGDCLSLV